MSQARLPEVIYHYTSMDALIKIVRSASIWATAINYLNDVAEGEHFLKLAQLRISALKGGAEFSKYMPLQLQNSFEGGPRIFVSSFCRWGDSLPQWRSYCAKGNGVAIGLRSRCLESARIVGKQDNALETMTNATLGPIQYVSADETEYIDASIASALSRGKDYETDSESDHVERVKAMARWVLERQAVFIKDKGFQSENEFRLVVSPIMPIRPYIQFRVTRSTLIPYLELRIPRTLYGANEVGTWVGPYLPGDPPQSQSSFIDRVVIGPSPNQELSASSVNAFLLSEQIDAEVVKSEISYRDW